jgi:hypothetical protein
MAKQQTEEELIEQIREIILSVFLPGDVHNHDQFLSTRRICNHLKEFCGKEYDHFDVFSALELAGFNHSRIGDEVEWWIRNK